MTMTPQEFTLDQLADAAGVEPRTVRSYVERNLLPGPLRRGRGATYSADAMVRILAVRRLLEQRGVTLDNIGTLFESASPDLIERIADGREEIHTLPIYEHRTLGRADYSPDRDLGSASFSECSGNDTRELEALLGCLRGLTRRAASGRRDGSGTWHRATVTPDLEITVRASPGRISEDELVHVANRLRALLIEGHGESCPDDPER